MSCNLIEKHFRACRLYKLIEHRHSRMCLVCAVSGAVLMLYTIYAKNQEIRRKRVDEN